MGTHLGEGCFGHVNECGGNLSVLDNAGSAVAACICILAMCIGILYDEQLF